MKAGHPASMKEGAGLVHNRIVVVANGDLSDPQYIHRQIRADDTIICADGGALHALAMGLQPALVVGDMDSLPSHLIKRLKDGGAQFLRFPVEKDQSDLELALERAVEMAPAEILLLAALGGERLDQAFGNLMLLTIPLRAGIPAQIIDERHRVFLVDSEITLQGSPGEIVSLFPLTAAVYGVKTEGLKYPLCGETLYFASTRGLSNVFSGASARVSTVSGLLLVILHRQPL
jgi:thiamine pyrophosphokinase